MKQTINLTRNLTFEEEFYLTKESLDFIFPVIVNVIMADYKENFQPKLIINTKDSENYQQQTEKLANLKKYLDSINCLHFR